MGLKLQTLVLTRLQGPAPMGIFERVNTLTAEALTTLKGVAAFGAALVIAVSLIKGEGLARLVTILATVAIALWLIVLGGMEQVAELFGQTVEA